MNLTARNSVINVFMCPSDGFASPATNFNSYLASQGTTAQGNPSASTGMFSSKMAYSLATITDGSMNTIAYSEKLVGVPNKTLYRGNGVNGTSVTGPYDAEQSPAVVLSDLQQCTTAFKSGSNIKTNEGQYWIVGSEVYTMFTTIVTPNSTQYPWGSCRNGCAGCSPDSSQYINASSNHSGGVNVLMGDGSVHFTKNSVSQYVWWSLGTASNGEVISADAY